MGERTKNRSEMDEKGGRLSAESCHSDVFRVEQESGSRKGELVRNAVGRGRQRQNSVLILNRIFP